MVYNRKSKKEITQFLKESFKDVYNRELRLSDTEFKMLKEIYPNATVSLMDDTETENSDKRWYKVQLGSQ